MLTLDDPPRAALTPDITTTEGTAVVSTIEPGLNHPAVLYSPDMDRQVFTHHLTADADTIHENLDGDERHSSHEYLHHVYVPTITNVDPKPRYVALTPHVEHRVEATSHDTLKVTARTGRRSYLVAETTRDEYLVVHHPDLDVRQLEVWYEEVVR